MKKQTTVLTIGFQFNHQNYLKMGRFLLNGKAIMVNSKFVEYNNGALSLYVRGDHFPYSNYEPPNPSTQNYNNSYFLALSSESNTATIDYGDGNVINYTFKANQLLFIATTITENTTTQARHNYANTIEGDRLYFSPQMQS